MSFNNLSAGEIVGFLSIGFLIMAVIILSSAPEGLKFELLNLFFMYTCFLGVIMVYFRGIFE